MGTSEASRDKAEGAKAAAVPSGGSAEANRAGDVAAGGTRRQVLRVGTLSTAEWVFLVSVACCGLFVAGRAVRRAEPLLPWVATETEPPSGAAGRPRDVDMDRLLDLLNQGRLSDHEALFYRRLSTTPETGVGTASTDPQPAAPNETSRSDAEAAPPANVRQTPFGGKTEQSSGGE